MKGKIIVFEGIDGSGKGTHAGILFKQLRDVNHKVEKIAFPQYGKKSARKVEQYLQGEVKDLDVKEVSKLYAEDRVWAKESISKWLNQDKIIIVDRYVASNMGHQGGKISDIKERYDFFDWLYNFEYSDMGIPKPDLQLFLDVQPKTSKSLIAGDVTRTTTDIHEEDTNHLENAYHSYKDFVDFSKKRNDIFYVVECEVDGKMKDIDEVNKDIFECVKKII